MNNRVKRQRCKNVPFASLSMQIWAILFSANIMYSHSVLTISVLMIKIHLYRHQEISVNGFYYFFGSFQHHNRLLGTESCLRMDKEYFQHQSRGSGYTSMVLTASFPDSLHISPVCSRRTRRINAHLQKDKKSSLNIRPPSAM